MPARPHPTSRGSAGDSDQQTPSPLREGRSFPWFENVIMRVPARTYHTLVFGASLAALARVILAWLTDQSTVSIAVGYAGVVTIAFVLSKQSARMADRTPRMFTSGFALLTFSVSSVFPVEATVESTRYAAATIGVLAVGTAIGELLHRWTAVTPTPPAAADVPDAASEPSLADIVRILSGTADDAEAGRQLRELARVG